MKISTRDQMRLQNILKEKEGGGIQRDDYGTTERFAGLRTGMGTEGRYTTNYVLISEHGSSRLQNTEVQLPVSESPGQYILNASQDSFEEYVNNLFSTQKGGGYTGLLIEQIRSSQEERSNEANQTYYNPVNQAKNANTNQDWTGPYTQLLLGENITDVPEHENSKWQYTEASHMNEFSY
ncbi:hypothetical protein EJB05_30272, partial [Eragrostis curvula]